MKKTMQSCNGSFTSGDYGQIIQAVQDLMDLFDREKKVGLKPGDYLVGAEATAFLDRFSSRNFSWTAAGAGGASFTLQRAFWAGLVLCGNFDYLF
jgi:hypothetical protein